MPRALLAAITSDELQDEALMQLRADDRAHDDSILVSRAVEEDKRIASVEKPGDRTWVDTLMSPFNRAKENRDKVLA